jgi:diguanylate cyclase (GGDEF)-like protein
MATTTATAVPPTTAGGQSHHPKELVVRLERVAGTLVGLTKSRQGEKLSTPIIECVKELHIVWDALRSRATIAEADKQTATTSSQDKTQDIDEDAGSKFAQACGNAVCDGLTRVLSRAAFEQRLAELTSQAAAITGNWCVAIAHIDPLRRINKKHGRHVGDALLCRVAEVIEKTSETFPGTIVGRYGGQEFGILLPRCSLRVARLMAEEARAAVARCKWEVRAWRVPAIISATLSIGVTEHRGDESAAELLRRAEECLERAKRAGPDTVAAEG